MYFTAVMMGAFLSLCSRNYLIPTIGYSTVILHTFYTIGI
jgi:hypothetical protein